MNTEERKDNAEKDIMLKMCKAQGYVKPECVLNGYAVMALTTQGKNPCHGCNLGSICGVKGEVK